MTWVHKQINKQTQTNWSKVDIVRRPKRDHQFSSLRRRRPECMLNALAKKANLVNVIDSCFFKPLHFLLDCQKHQRWPLQEFCHKHFCNNITIVGHAV